MNANTTVTIKGEAYRIAERKPFFRSMSKALYTLVRVEDGSTWETVNAVVRPSGNVKLRRVETEAERARRELAETAREFPAGTRVRMAGRLGVVTGPSAWSDRVKVAYDAGGEGDPRADHLEIVTDAEIERENRELIAGMEASEEFTRITSREELAAVVGIEEEPEEAPATTPAAAPVVGMARCASWGVTPETDEEFEARAARIAKAAGGFSFDAPAGWDTRIARGGGRTIHDATGAEIGTVRRAESGPHMSLWEVRMKGTRRVYRDWTPPEAMQAAAEAQARKAA